MRGNAASVLKAIDVFGYARHWMMHSSHSKSPYIRKAMLTARRQIVARQQFSENGERIKGEADDEEEIEDNDVPPFPLICVEIGSYCGYSAVNIASQLSGGVLYCLEIHPKCVAWTQRMVEFAGLSDRVRVLHSAVDSQALDSLQGLIAADYRRLFPPASASTTASTSANTSASRHSNNSEWAQRSATEVPAIDLLFIDHEKSLYLDDLKIVESHQLLTAGSVVVADNVLSFGVPLQGYLDHVRGPPLSESAAAVVALKRTSTSPSTTPKDSPSKTTTLKPKTTTNYSSSTCYKCFIEYSRHEEYTEEKFGNSAEVDGVEVSVYKGR